MQTTPDVMTVFAQAVTTIVAVAGATVLSHFKGKSREKTSGEKLDSKFAEQREYIDRRLGKLDDKVTAVHALCVGPDGQNGFRSRINRLEERFDDFEDRERARLEPRDVGALDRRGGR